MKNYKTEQEGFWAGDFGDEYVDRNRGDSILSANLSMFSNMLSNVTSVNSVIEFGANIGLNLISIKKLLPMAELSAVEINLKAVEELRSIGYIQVFHQSILDYTPDYVRDLVLIKGVLIHINPDSLSSVYDMLYKTSSRYICVAEYYNPVPVEVNYRGHKGKLFKRDFAGEMMDMYKDLRLVKYGFIYHRDPLFPQDDITWFLLEK